ncbi:MAG: hypothetical protein OEW68_06875 [Gammaproteobacteria bacterium]|nr:hypothetical protein [Gammaproteobacteria bacterium]MDH4314547.1 hypothetical protein [Gammaproteobacteria bacterium]MDH5213972.1 hypothetical protein [Gammaproteobacteria bacterium]
MSPKLRIFALALIGATLVACGGSQIKLADPTIPEPLIDKLPLSVAARYPENFSHFVHEEVVIGKEKWSIDLGRANEILFTQLFSSMFTDYRVIPPGTDPQDLAIDAYIEPSIDAFEFSVPSQSQTEEFAVWIRYRIKIFDDEGNQIANWPISAYGKSLTTTFGSDAALRRAAVLAMRDAAALVILQMDKATGISKLSAATLTPDVPARPAATENPTDEKVMQTIATEEPSDDSGI